MLRALLTPLDVITIWTLVLTGIGITYVKVKTRDRIRRSVRLAHVVVLATVALAAATS